MRWPWLAPSLSLLTLFLLAIISVASVAILSAAAPATVPSVASGGPGVFVVTADGTLQAWTSKRPGPTPIPLPARAVQVAATYGTAYVLIEDGTVMGWGSNDFSALGMSNAQLRQATGGASAVVDTPRAIPGLSDIIQIAAAVNHAVALRRDGAVLAWGASANGLRGDAGDRPTPGAISIATAASARSCSSLQPVRSRPNALSCLKSVYRFRTGPPGGHTRWRRSHAIRGSTCAHGSQRAAARPPAIPGSGSDATSASTA